MSQGGRVRPSDLSRNRAEETVDVTRKVHVDAAADFAALRAAEMRLAKDVLGAQPDAQPTHEREHGRSAEETVGAAAAAAAADVNAEPGVMLGRYLVLEPLGRGGMGVVLAAFDSALERKVALKLVRPPGREPKAAARSRSALRREAQALAALAHPNVVPVYDVGEFSIPDSPPGLYIAMELQPGQTLRQWAKKPRPWRDIVDVFLDAGRGLAAAHRAGIVHGDFKPANVVRRDDGRVVVLDFGLARHSSHFDGPQIGEHRGTLSKSGVALPVVGEPTLAEPGFIMGTPAYLAPEQYRGQQGEAADQFAFCVALYRTLFGRHPFAGDGDDELELVSRRIQRGVPIEVPSSRVGPTRLRAIVARGLARDPAERWPSMDALLRELARTRRSRARQIAVAAVGFGGLGAALSLMLVPPGGDVPGSGVAPPTVGESWSAARRERLRAAVQALPTDSSGAQPAWLLDSAAAAERDLDRFVQAWLLEHERLQGSAAWPSRKACLDDVLAEMTTLVDLLIAADVKVWARAERPTAALTRPERCRSVTEGAELRDGSAAARDVRRLVAQGQAQLHAGHHAAATAVATEASALAREHAFVELVARSDKLLADAYTEAGDYDAALEHLRAVAWSCSLVACDTLAVEAMAQIVHLHGAETGDFEQGIRWEARARERVDKAGGHDPRLEAEVFNAIGTLRLAQAEYTEAEAAYDEVVVRIQNIPQADLRLASVYNNLGTVYEAQGRAADAASTVRRALDIRQAVLGDEHPSLASSLSNLGLAELAADDLDAAMGHFERAIEITEAAWGKEHLSLARLHNNLANVHYNRGANEAARKSYQQTLDVLERSFGSTHPNVALTLLNLGLVQDNAEDALVLHRRALAALQQSVREGHPFRGMAHNNIGSALRRLGRLDQARSSYLRALEIREAALGPDHPLVGTTVDNLGTTALQAGDADLAVGYHERALKIWTAAYDDDHRKVTQAKTGLAAALVYASPDDPEAVLRARRLAQAAVDALVERESDAADRAATEVVLAHALMVGPDADPRRARALATKARSVLSGPQAEGRDSELKMIETILRGPN